MYLPFNILSMFPSLWKILSCHPSYLECPKQMEKTFWSRVCGWWWAYWGAGPQTLVLSIDFHGHDVHTKALYLSSSQAEEGKSWEQLPCKSLPFTPLWMQIVMKETTYLKQEYIIPYENFAKNSVHVDNLPCHGTLHFSFPPEASLVIHVLNNYWMQPGGHKRPITKVNVTISFMWGSVCVVLYLNPHASYWWLTKTLLNIHATSGVRTIWK